MIKRFISQIIDKLCNWLFFYLYLMLHVCAVRFDVTGILKKIVKFL